MKAVLISEFGGPEVLKLQDVPEPKPGKDQVVIAARAIGVNLKFVRPCRFPLSGRFSRRYNLFEFCAGK